MLDQKSLDSTSLDYKSDRLSHDDNGHATMQSRLDGKISPKAKNGALHRQFDGIDVFVEWDGEVSALAQTMRSACAVGDFRFLSITTEGTVSRPNGDEHTHQVAQWRCRFTVAGDPETVEFEVPWLLSVIGERIRWTHVVKHERQYDNTSVSRAQIASAP